MDKLVKIHHTLTDWNYQAGVNWFISSVRYVSPPSSLARPNIEDGPASGRVALKESVSGNLKDGRLITYHLSVSPGNRVMRCYARAQTSPHLGEPLNGYFLYIDFTRCDIYRRVDGETTYLKENIPCPFTWNTNAWHRFRFTWYTFMGADLQLVLKLIVEYEEGGTWLPWTQVNDTPYWQESATNLVGFFVEASNPVSPTHVDDTQIWKSTT